MSPRPVILALALPLLILAPAAAPAGEPPPLQGYAEGDVLLIATPTGGILAELAVAEGDHVTAGAPLFALDTTIDRAERDRAAADRDRARAVLADLAKGQRPDEIRALTERQAQARAALTLSEATLKRQEALARADVASRAKLDEARAALERDRALVRQLAAELRTARLGARPDAIDAQQALVAEAEAALVRAERRLADLAPRAPAAGTIERLYYRPGETVPAARPVLALLPPENVKLVFFVPQARLATVAPGRTVRFRADGGPEGVAMVGFVSARAEYTPPVIYSVGSRDKLVYRVEARGTAQPLPLRPGQPVDVTPEP